MIEEEVQDKLLEFKKVAKKALEKPDNRSNREIYNSIVEQIKSKHNGTLTDDEARKAADNMIAMTKKILRLLL